MEGCLSVGGGISKFFPGWLSPYPSTLPDEEDISASRGVKRAKEAVCETGLSTVEDIEAGEGRRESETSGRENISEEFPSSGEVAVEKHTCKAG